MSKFKVGDLVESGPNNSYHKTGGEGFVGVVIQAGLYGPNDIRVQIIKSCKNGGVDEDYAVESTKFKLYTGPDPRGKSLSTNKVVSKSKEFMEGVDIRLLSGEIAHIDTYLHYGDGMGCWMMQVTINGSKKNIWESECIGYPGNKVVEKVEPIRLGEGLYKQISKPMSGYSYSIDPIISKSGVLVKDSLGKWELRGSDVPLKFDSKVKVFDLTPKKRKRISIFNPK